MRLMLAIAEAYPFAKTGGLGDVGAALPKALARRGHDVRLVLPGYPSLATGRPAEVLPLRVGRRHEHVALHHNGLHDGVDVWSVHHARHFSAATPYVGSLYEADVDPFVVFSVAAAELARRWRPDVVHVHDWHPALAPQLMRARAPPPRARRLCRGPHHPQPRLPGPPRGPRRAAPAPRPAARCWPRASRTWTSSTR